MGLGAKLAASQGQSHGPTGAQPGGYPPPPQAQQAGGAYPGQSQYRPSQGMYQAYPGVSGGLPPSGAPPGQQGPYPPPQGNSPHSVPPHQQYGAHPPGAGSQQTAAYKQVLMRTIEEKHLQSMFPPNDPTLDRIASRVTTQVDELCAKWRVPREVGQDIVKLALFDIVLFVDDSGSMSFEENGERLKDLKIVLGYTAYAASLFDDDGIQVRFMNSDVQGNCIRDEREAEALVDRVPPKGLTPMGTSLRNKVIDPLVLGPARAGQLRKPVLIITVTDGQPAGESPTAVFDAIKYATSELSRMPRYGAGACSFQFAQVGNDLKAREFLGKLDSDPGIGAYVDCTSNYEVESDEMSRARPPVDLTVQLWICKLLLGAIDSSYDEKDEQGSGGHAGTYVGPAPSSGPGGYSGQPQMQYPSQPGYVYPPQGLPPPPQQYGQPSQQYGQPPQQYGQPPQQYGQPPQQYGQQPQQYGQPSQQYGKPGQPSQQYSGQPHGYSQPGQQPAGGFRPAQGPPYPGGGQHGGYPPPPQGGYGGSQPPAGR